MVSCTVVLPGYLLFLGVLVAAKICARRLKRK